MTDLMHFLELHTAVMAVRLDQTKGSTPRDSGTVMYVSQQSVFGTIGGGQLEYMAIDQARKMLRAGTVVGHMDVPLGPEIGQCCGGRVLVSLGLMDQRARAAALRDHVRSQERAPQVLIFGAGHVGRALALALNPLPVRAVLIDNRSAELALDESGVEQRLTPLPEAEIDRAAPGSAYVVVTHDHALDFLIAAQALARRDACYVGMIGSKTKRAKFRSYCRETDGPDAAPLVCPIGGSFKGDKNPAVIAAMVAAELIPVVMADHSAIGMIAARQG